MDWQSFVLKYSAAQVMEWTGAPHRTVYCWRDGSSSPPEWFQPILKAHILKASKKPNKSRQGNR